eukprot:jgi/Ulvmu1/6199/UM028_0055.1
MYGAKVSTIQFLALATYAVMASSAESGPDLQMLDTSHCAAAFRQCTSAHPLQAIQCCSESMTCIGVVDAAVYCQPPASSQHSLTHSKEQHRPGAGDLRSIGSVKSQRRDHYQEDLLPEEATFVNEPLELSNGDRLADFDFDYTDVQDHDTVYAWLTYSVDDYGSSDIPEPLVEVSGTEQPSKASAEYQKTAKHGVRLVSEQYQHTPGISDPQSLEYFDSDLYYFSDYSEVLF